MKIELTKEERNELIQVATVQKNERVKKLLGTIPGPVTVRGQENVQRVRSLACMAGSSLTNFDHMDSIIDKADSKMFA